jgi:hypothetical protein
VAKYEVYITKQGAMQPRPQSREIVVGFKAAKLAAKRMAYQLMEKGYETKYHGELFFDWCMYDCTKGRSTLQIRVWRIEE